MRVPASTLIATLIALIVPLLGFGAAIVFLWGWGFHWTELGLLPGMYVLTLLGVTVGFHRLFTHRSFETNKVVRCILGVLGSMALQGSVLKWVAIHRRHHQHSDDPDDPHSPHHSGTGFLGTLRGWWHAHAGWFFQPDPPNLSRYVRDLSDSRLIRFLSSTFPLWVLVGLAIPSVLGLLLIGGWKGALLGLFWGGLARIFLVHHIGWCTNSICHLWGRQPYKGQDRSKNNFVLGVLTLGEGFHNNHHAFPTSARHGLRWWQIDVSYYVIRMMAWLGLARNVRLPSLHAGEASVKKHRGLGSDRLISPTDSY